MMRSFFVLLLSALLAIPGIASATGLEALVEAGRLAVDLRIETEGPLYQRTPVIVAVEIATPRWFSRGTRVRDFHIPGAFVRPVSNFADNQSTRINGDTWSVQRWRFRIFAEQAGQLEIPPLRVFVSVNSQDFGVLEGELTLPPEQLTITTPPGAPESGRWIAARALTADEQWQGERESYVPGDALTRVRRFTVVDAPAMISEASSSEPIEGVEIYAAPPDVADQQDRGALSGVREERTVFTLESPGTYVLPGYELPWFNTESQRFELATLPARTITILEGGPAAIRDRASLDYAAYLPALGLALLLALALIALRRVDLSRLRQSAAGQWASASLRQRRIRRAYRSACQCGDLQACVALLYERLEGTGELCLSASYRGDAALLAIYERLMRHAYTDTQDPSTRPDKRELLALWHQQRASAGSSARNGSALSLNPGSPAAETA